RASAASTSARSRRVSRASASTWERSNAMVAPSGSCSSSALELTLASTMSWKYPVSEASRRCDSPRRASSASRSSAVSRSSSTPAPCSVERAGRGGDHAVGVQARGDVLERGERNVLGGRAVGDAGDAERLVLGGAQRAGQADDRDLALADALDQLPGDVGVEDAWHEHDVGAGVEVGP